jgi:hypothetical protein
MVMKNFKILWKNGCQQLLSKPLEITHKMVMKIFKILWKNGCQQLSFGPIFALPLKPGFWFPKMQLTFEEAPSMY